MRILKNIIAEMHIKGLALSILLAAGSLCIHATNSIPESSVAAQSIDKTNPLLKVADKKGATIKGVVFSGQLAVQGVRVSDGVSTTVTDQNGNYWLTSDKKHGYVFIVLPSGYEPVSEVKSIPSFWQSLTASPKNCEQVNFELATADNDKHIMLVAADFHLANRNGANDDMLQFSDKFVNETSQFINENADTHVYTMVLGDMTWDMFWHSKKYGPKEYVETMKPYPGYVFHVMGNHDNDPRREGDFEGEIEYKKHIGPTYYSMNIGKVHYVVLDNTVSINTGGAPGVNGARDYKSYVTDEQLNWLKDDLAAITDKSTPIVVGIHCPSHNNYNKDFELRPGFDTKEQLQTFMDCFATYDNVHLLSGHAHHNMTVDLPGGNAIEHNVAAVCETWWWTGKVADRNLCKDGSPSGYEIFNIDGTSIDWYYKGFGLDKQYQFRTYDVNLVKDFFRKTDVVEVFNKLPKNKQHNEFEEMTDNTVLINIWNYDDRWTILVKEDGRYLPVKRIFVRDPMHRQFYDYARTRKEGKAASPVFFTNPNNHMFEVQASSPTSTIEIAVTDRFGNLYKETMQRPKIFENTKMN